MKLIPFLLALSAVVLLAGCADNSLMSDEEYRDSTGPAAHSPDPTRHLPSTNPYNRRY